MYVPQQVERFHFGQDGWFGVVWLVSCGGVLEIRSVGREWCCTFRSKTLRKLWTTTNFAMQRQCEKKLSMPSMHTEQKQNAISFIQLNTPDHVIHEPEMMSLSELLKLFVQPSLTLSPAKSAPPLHMLAFKWRDIAAIRSFDVAIAVWVKGGSM